MKLFSFGKEKTPQNKIRRASTNIRNLERKKNALPRSETKRINKLEDEILRNKTERSIGYAELGQPRTEINTTKNSTNNLTINNKKKSLGGIHYHNDKGDEK